MTEFDTPAVGRSEESEAYQFLDTLSYVRVSGSETDGRTSVVEMRMRAGHATPMHVHEETDETFHVLDGRLVAHTEGGERELTAGESAVMPRGQPHGLVVPEETTAIVTTTPAGFDEFVTAVGERMSEPSVPDSPPPERMIERVERLGPEYGIQIVGPPPE